MTSAGPYASLHVAPYREPRQQHTTQFFTGRMPFLPPNQQRQSTEGIKVLHNSLYKKLLDRKAPLCFVLLLINWYSKLHCAVKWNGFMAEWFPILFIFNIMLFLRQRHAAKRSTTIYRQHSAINRLLGDLAIAQRYRPIAQIHRWRATPVPILLVRMSTGVPTKLCFCH